MLILKRKVDGGEHEKWGSCSLNRVVFMMEEFNLCQLQGFEMSTVSLQID